ncbi:XRE family transcriptional regulator [Clostridium neonatale]|uniref:XRE family transcriptional regulator n=1 Tax=Clostridium neonatale TaxID=137838 RepID=UPI00291C22E8|nr:XRE family transcriptional regulator [Clostridium neonatale]CAI3208569.1 Helix-turn-helix domain protein [Clostridium neonatale]CAI3212863.1 Helix-turn-helix domain protein [Clostridium neonatale]
MNINLLKAQIALKGKKISDITDLLKISKSAIYRKLSGKSDFTRKEILMLINFLDISTEKAMEIFFNEKVS